MACVAPPGPLHNPSCFNCGEHGHDRASCPNPASEAGASAWAAYKSFKRAPQAPGQPKGRDSRAVLLRWMSELAATKAAMPTDETGVRGGGGGEGGREGGGGDDEGGREGGDGDGGGDGSRGAAERHVDCPVEHAVVYDAVCVAELRGTKRARQLLDNAMADHFKACLDPLVERIEIKGLGDGGEGVVVGEGGGGGGGDSAKDSGGKDAGANSTRQGDARHRMNGRLASAYHDGRPADFTDPAELEIYTQDRMRARCRYLYRVLLSPASICTNIRAKLLPMPPRAGGGGGGGGDADGAAAASISDPHRAFRCLSVGGGPAFDDVAIRVVASFLLATGTLAPHDDPGPTPVRIDSTILDLYEEEWTPAIVAVGNAVASRARRHEEVPAMANTADRGSGTNGTHGTNGTNGINGFTGEISGIGSVSIAHCDIRSSLEGAGNERFRELAPACDLFVFSFVLHENAEYLVNSSSGGGGDVDEGGGGGGGSDHGDEGVGVGGGDGDGAGGGGGGGGGGSGLVGGCLPGLFQSAKVGATMVMMDPTHRLWPNMIHTAMAHGWRAEVVVAKMGPPSGALVLEKVGVGPLDYPTATGGKCEALLAEFQKHHEQHQRGLREGSGAAGHERPPAAASGD